MKFTHLLLHCSGSLYLQGFQSGDFFTGEFKREFESLFIMHPHNSAFFTLPIAGFFGIALVVLFFAFS